MQEPSSFGRRKAPEPNQAGGLSVDELVRVYGQAVTNFREASARSFSVEPMWREFLKARNLDGVIRQAPELLGVLKDLPLPPALDSWLRRGYQLVSALYDENASIANMQARCVRADANGSKTMNPRGLAIGGLVFANALGQSLLRGSLPVGATILICEGWTDFVTAAIAVPHMCVLSVPGASNAAAAVGRWAKGRVVIIATDSDEAGSKAAVAIARRVNGLGGRTMRLDPKQLLSTAKDLNDVSCAVGPTEFAHLLAESCVEGSPRLVVTFGERVLACTAPEAGKEIEPATLPVRNFLKKKVIDEDGKESEERVAIAQKQIVAEVHSGFDNWPRRVGTRLFEHRNVIRYLDDEYGVFSWLRERREIQWAIGVDWLDNNFVRRREFLAALQNAGIEYAGIEHAATFPEPPGIYVAERIEPDEACVPAFEAFIDFFAPATPLDRVLIKSLVLTVLWGGAPGTRPLVLITGVPGESKCGQGKSRLAAKIAKLAGGHFEVRIGEERYEDSLVKQLVSDKALQYRVALFDNLEGVLDSNELTRLITSEFIDGRASYGEQARRPNRLTYVATAVKANFSGELRSRCIPIYLRTPRFDPDWEVRVDEFLATNRTRVIAGAFHILRDGIRHEIEKHSRFPTWDREVLSRFPECNDVLREWTARAQRVDYCDEQVAIFARELYRSLTCADFPDLRAIKDGKLSATQLAAVWNRAIGGRSNMQAHSLGRLLRTHSNEGSLPHGITPPPPERASRGGLWRVDALALKQWLEAETMPAEGAG